MNKLSFRLKLVVAFFAAGLLPMLLTTGVGYFNAKSAVEDGADQQLRLVAENKSNQIATYFNQEMSGLQELAENPFVISSLKDFSKAFESMNQEPSPEQIKSVSDFYKSQFSSEYTKRTNGGQFDDEAFIGSLDTRSINLQYDYISNNSNPLGEKDKLVVSGRSHSYSAVHSQNHPFFSAYQKRRALYDVFLVNSAGRIVYSVFKETDFTADIAIGPLAKSGIGQAFSASISVDQGGSHLNDFSPYGPSYEAPASFASSPIFENGKFIGSIIIQLPLDKISAVVANREGLQDQGQAILLGADGRLRADAFRQKDKYSVSESFKKESTIALYKDLVGLTMKGESGVSSISAYDGLDVRARYVPLKISNLTWTLVVELANKELYASLLKMKISFLVVATLALFFVSVFGYFGSRALAKQLMLIVSSLETTSEKVNQSSQDADGSAASLSSATTEQAASIQETMASAEEISAMITQNAESAEKANGTLKTNNELTQKGALAVDKVVIAIDEIKSTNDEILDQMESSNREFAQIVRIISEIGEKTKVINDIVFQTKLLSFNASVEAARAGEHGKGFAVVAEEVGNLARMSGNAAKEISDMLNDSIKRVNGIVNETKSKVEQLVEIGKDKIAVGIEVTTQSKSVLTTLSQNASVLTAMITEIVTASKEQAQGIREINSAISQMDQVTQKNSMIAQQSSSQAEILLHETKNLQDATNRLINFVSGADGVSGHSSKVRTPSTQSPNRTVESNGPNLVVMNNSRAMPVASNSRSGPAGPNKTGQKAISHEKIAAGHDVAPAFNKNNFEKF